MCPRSRRVSVRRRASTRRPRAPFGLWATLALTLGMLFSQLVQLSHFFLVEHAVCVHGEFVHEGEAKHALESSREDAREQHLRATAAPEKDGHEHCDSNVVRHLTPEIGPSLAEATLLALIEIPAQVAHPERRPSSPLELAPKSSPPTA